MIETKNSIAGKEPHENYTDIKGIKLFQYDYRRDDV